MRGLREALAQCGKHGDRARLWRNVTYIAQITNYNEIRGGFAELEKANAAAPDMQRSRTDSGRRTRCWKKDEALNIN